MKFSNYKNNATVSVTPDTLASNLITWYDLTTKVDPQNIYGEAALDIFSHSSLDNFSCSDISGLVNALYFLNRKLEATRKSISFWDAYQIYDTVGDRDEVLGQIANLPVNSSLVSNLRDPFEWINADNQTETVYQGDLFIKDYNGNTHLVHGLSQGSYRPSTTWEADPTASNTYILTYSYTEGANVGDTVNTELELSNTVVQGYNFTGTLNANSSDVTFPYVLDTNNYKIAPVVKYFISSTHEQVFFDTLYTVSGSNFILHNPTSETLIYEVK